MGVTGVGKTTVGRALADELQWRFADADDYHPPANIAKMKAGIPLDDADRAPWLQALRSAIMKWVAAGENVVLACSALKQSYRDMLMVGPEVKLVYLHGSFEVLARRLAERREHYMDPSLLKSQFDTLEEPHGAISISVEQPVEETVKQIRTALGI
jgi:gluconokinase